MRIKSIRGAGVLAALAALTALAPGRSLAQESWPQGGFATGYAPPAVPLPNPLYSTHPEVGGLFVAGSYVMYNQTNTLKSQEVAQRGFVVTDDTVLNAAGSAGTFVGSKNNALDVNQVTGPFSFQPGFKLELGWKFGDGSSLTASFMWISETQYSAVATLAQPIGGSSLIRSDQADTFLFSPVFNFPSDFAGAANKIVNGTAGPFSVYGIWNGASAMTLSFRQRAQTFDLTYRKPFYETENYRASALVGPRWFQINELFRWVTTDLDALGQSSPIFSATYNNQVTNNMYGLYTGLQQEWYLGWGLAAMLNLNAAMFLDSVRESVDYERGDRGGPENKRTRRVLKAVPEVQVTPSLMWYPIEGVQMQFAYDVFAFFNTVASPNPIDFNYSSINPGYSDVFRLFNGFQATIAFIF